jgi:hypothetical protein
LSRKPGGRDFDKNEVVKFSNSFLSSIHPEMRSEYRSSSLRILSRRRTFITYYTVEFIDEPGRKIEVTNLDLRHIRKIRKRKKRT